MVKKILFLLLYISFIGALSSQIYEQDFESSNLTFNYVSAIPDTGELTEISNSATVPASIVNGALRIEKTGSVPSFFYRTPNPVLMPEPTFIQMQFDLRVRQNQSGFTGSSREIPFYFGPSFNEVGTSVSEAHSRFGIGISATQGNFYLKVLDNGSNTSLDFSGRQTITFVLNNSGSTQTYTAPNGNNETVGNDGGRFGLVQQEFLTKCRQEILAWVLAALRCNTIHFCLMLPWILTILNSRIF